MQNIKRIDADSVLSLAELPSFFSESKEAESLKPFSVGRAGEVAAQILQKDREIGPSYLSNKELEVLNTLDRNTMIKWASRGLVLASFIVSIGLSLPLSSAIMSRMPFENLPLVIREFGGFDVFYIVFGVFATCGLAVLVDLGFLLVYGVVVGAPVILVTMASILLSYLVENFAVAKLDQQSQEVLESFKKFQLMVVEKLLVNKQEECSLNEEAVIPVSSNSIEKLAAYVKELTKLEKQYEFSPETLNQVLVKLYDKLENEEVKQKFLAFLKDDSLVARTLQISEDKVF